VVVHQSACGMRIGTPRLLAASGRLVEINFSSFYKLVQGILYSDGGEGLVDFGRWFLRELALDLGW